MPCRVSPRRVPSHVRCHGTCDSLTVNIVAFTRVCVKREGQHLGQSKQQL